MDQRGQADHLLDLVFLQMADKVQRRALIGTLRLLFQHLLHAVFPADIHAGGDRLAYALSVVHFAGRHQCDFLRLSSGGDGRRRDFGADPRHIFRNRHVLSFFLSAAGPVFGRRRLFFLYSSDSKEIGLGGTTVEIACL